MRPLRLYLIIIAVNFFLFSSYKPVAIYDFARIAKQDATGALENAIQEVAKKKNKDPREYMDAITVRWQKTMSVAQFLNVFLLACILAVFFRQHRSYFVEHLVFALHFASFFFMMSCLSWPIYVKLGVELSVHTWVIFGTMSVLSIVYLYFGILEFYGGTRWIAAFRAVFALFAMQICIGFTIILSLVLAAISFHFAPI